MTEFALAMMSTLEALNDSSFNHFKIRIGMYHETYTETAFASIGRGLLLATARFPNFLLIKGMKLQGAGQLIIILSYRNNYEATSLETTTEWPL